MHGNCCVQSGHVAYVVIATVRLETSSLKAAKARFNSPSFSIAPEVLISTVYILFNAAIFLKGGAANLFL